MTSQTETDAVRVSVRGFPWFIVNSICGLVFLFFAFGDVSWTSFERALSGSADFTIFYTAARLVREYPPSKLYDLETQSHVQREVLGAYILPRGFLPYNHPPFEMLLFLPMGYLSYRGAFLVWLGVNLCSIFCLPWTFAKENAAALGKQRVTVLLAGLSFFPFFTCLIQGQDSILFLWCVLWVYLLMKKGNRFQSGVLLGLAFFKFHIAIFLVLPLILKRRLRELSGVTLSLGGLILWSILWIGISQMKVYFGLLLKLSATQNLLGFSPGKFQNWSGQLYLLGFRDVHGPWGAFACGLVGLSFLVMVWRGEWKVCEESFGLRFAATVLLAVLASPHLYIHDLSVLFLALCLVLEFLLIGGGNRTSVLLGILLLCTPFVLILTLPLSQEIPIQLSVTWMSVMLLVIIVILRTRYVRVILPEAATCQLL